MGEGNVYLCSWEKRASDYYLELDACSEINAQGLDIRELKDLISEKVLTWNGDGEAIIELIPPFEGDASVGTSFSVLGYNNSVRVLNAVDLFDGGLCKKCKFGIGNRTKKPLEINEKPKGSVLGVLGVRPNMRIYHKSLVQFLNIKSETRQVFFDGNETEYVELICSDAIQQVGHINARYPKKFHQNWECTKCGRRKIHPIVEGYENNTLFISGGVFDGKVPTIFFIDSGMTTHLAVHNQVLDRMLCSKNFEGLTSNPVAVLTSSKIEMPRKLYKPWRFDW